MFKRPGYRDINSNLRPIIAKVTPSNGPRLYGGAYINASLSDIMKKLDMCYYSLLQLNDHETAIKIASSALVYKGQNDLVLGAIIEILIDWVEYDSVDGILKVQKWLRVIIEDWGMNSPDLHMIKQELTKLRRLELYDAGKRTREGCVVRKKRQLYGGNCVILKPKNPRNDPQKSRRCHKSAYTHTTNSNISIDRNPAAASWRFKSNSAFLSLSRRETKLIATYLSNDEATLPTTEKNSYDHPTTDWEGYLNRMSRNLGRFYSNSEITSVDGLKRLLTMGYGSGNGEGDEDLCGFDIYSQRYNPSPVETFGSCISSPVVYSNHRSVEWAHLFTALKAKIFKVCKLVNVNINVPFIAIEIFSIVLQNVTCGTDQQLFSLFGFIFNTEHGDFVAHLGSGRNFNSSLTNVDIAMFYLVAVNCLQLALYILNGNIRFDVSNLLYLLVFVDVIVINGNCSEYEQPYQRLKNALPQMLSRVDCNMVMQQKLNYGTAFVSRTCKYHHDLLKHHYGHLIKELKRNKLLQVIGIETLGMPSCLDYFHLFTHGTFCHRLHERVYEAMKRSQIERDVGLGITRTTRRVRSFYYKNQSLKDSNALDSRVEAEVYTTEVAIVLLHILSRSVYMEVLNGNSLFTTKKTSKEVSGGDSGKFNVDRVGEVIKLNPSMLKALVVIKFMIDMFFNADDINIDTNAFLNAHQLTMDPPDISSDSETAVKLFKTFHCKESKGELVAEMSQALNAHLDENSISRLNAGYSLMYLEILKIDWIMHHGGVYKGQDYQSYYKTMGLHARNSKGLETLDEEAGYKSAYPAECRFYHAIAMRMCGDEILACNGTLEHFRNFGSRCNEATAGVPESVDFNEFVGEFSDLNYEYSNEDADYRETTKMFFQGIYYPEMTHDEHELKWDPYEVLHTCKHLKMIADVVIRCKLNLLRFFYENDLRFQNDIK